MIHQGRGGSALNVIKYLFMLEPTDSAETPTNKFEVFIFLLLQATFIMSKLEDVNLIMSVVLKFTSLTSFVIFIVINWDKIRKSVKKMFKKKKQC